MGALDVVILTNWFASMDVNNEARSLVTTQQLVFSWRKRNPMRISDGKHALAHVSRTLLELTGGRSWTGFTRLVPSFPHVVGTAAHLLGHVEGQLVFTRVVEVAVAHTLSHVCHARRKEVIRKGLTQSCLTVGHVIK